MKPDLPADAAITLFAVVVAIDYFGVCYLPQSIGYTLMVAGGVAYLLMVIFAVLWNMARYLNRHKGAPVPALRREGKEPDRPKGPKSRR